MINLDVYREMLYNDSMVRKCEVWVTKFAEKRLHKLPKHVLEAYATWIRSIEFQGIRAVRMIPGYHDEPLKGKRAGQRSVRLSRGYRVIYEESNEGDVTLIGIMEVNKHDY